MDKEKINPLLIFKTMTKKQILVVCPTEFDLLSQFSGAARAHLEKSAAITFTDSLTEAARTLKSGKYALVLLAEKLPSNSTGSPEPLVGLAILPICARMRRKDNPLRVALLIEEGSPLYTDDLDTLNLRSPQGNEIAYVYTLSQLRNEELRSGIEFALFGVKVK